MKPQPPKRALSFLRWFCREDCVEEIEGDLTELFQKQFEESPERARRKFAWRVVGHLRPEYINAFKFHPNHSTMLGNYLKVSWRSMSRQKAYSAIKIGGFSVGIAACLLIALFIKQELSYDKQFQNGDRIFRVIRDGWFKGKNYKGEEFPAPFAFTLQLEFPDVELAGRYNSVSWTGAGKNEVRWIERPESNYEDQIVYADQSLLDIFGVHFLEGDSKTALDEPNTVVLTESKAEKYFGEADPIGETLIFNNDESRQYKVTGVIPDFPRNTHFRFDFLLSLKGKEFYDGEKNNWQNQNYATYILVKPGTDVKALAGKFKKLINTYFLPAESGSDNADAIAWLKSLTFRLQPVGAIHMNELDVNDGLEHGDIRFIWLFASIAVFILLIACVNFINLSTARSANRAREVGLRKVSGSHRGSLIRQFLIESTLFSFLAFIIGFLIAAALLPYFNNLLGESLTFPWTSRWLLPVLISGTLLTGLLAGLYPAFYLSAFQPIQVLKGATGLGSRSASLRGALVVFQFTISILLIAGTVIIHRQMHFILNMKLGYNKDQVLVLQGTNTLGDKIIPFKNELTRLPQVSSATVTDYLPVSSEDVMRNGGPWWTDGMAQDQRVSAQQWSVDHDYVKTMGLQIVEGRDFRSNAADSDAVILNESLVKALHLNDPIGAQVYNYYRPNGKGWTVVGVVHDFHFESLKEHVGPLGLFIQPNTSTMAVRASSNDMTGLIKAVSALWKEFSPNQAIRYTFLDQQYASMYDDVQRMGNLLTIFTILAIVVACLGLFALSSFMIEQRGKEISIRLVLGASVHSVFALLTGNFVRLVLIAFVIATPLAWYGMHLWLEDFVYRVSLGWDVFAAAGGMALVIALTTISYQALRAAVMDPVKNLKSE